MGAAEEPQEPSGPPRIARRSLLGWSGAAGVAGLAAGGAGGFLAGRRQGDDAAAADAEADDSTRARLTPSDDHASVRRLPMGLGDRIPAFGTVLAFDLSPAARRAPDQARTAAIDFLTHVSRLADHAATASSFPTDRDTLDPQATAAASLDLRPASLQITPGVGASLLAACGVEHQRPEAFIDLPSFATDRLDPGLSHGDLLVQVGAEDPLKMSGVVQAVMSYVRTQLRDSVRLRWSRPGFRNTAAASSDPATTSRNLMGHRDGTDNPALRTPLWQISVQAQSPGWMTGGSYLVARQILIDLDAWFTHPESGRDKVIGRSTATGAALGQHRESQPVDLSARRSDGEPAVPAHAHIRLASPQNTGGARIYRRSWNFDDGYRDGRRRAGLMFLAWQADIRLGFLPIQHALTRHNDALNRFTTHIGSAVFAVPARGDDAYVGQRLLEA
ncbi:Dyp-type peroxidase [Nocardioides sp. DS6]|uniref:Dyp-type peroxidase n=1 Tax=Nocardioides eburneus TaxID=3231482 RepID=A0ABV3SVL0_9ACTN